MIRTPLTSFLCRKLRELQFENIVGSSWVFSDYWCHVIVLLLGGIRSIEFCLLFGTEMQIYNFAELKLVAYDNPPTHTAHDC